MKKKKDSNFLMRFFTGFIYVVLIVFSIQKGEKMFRIVMMMLSFFCLFEFLIISGTNTILIKIASLFFLFSIFMDIFIKKGLIPYIICFVPYSIIFFVIQLFSKKYSHKEKITQISHLIFGLVYIIMPFCLASYIYTIHHGRQLILGIFILIWTNDSLSYLIGKKWGKRKIALSISPKKSVEGFIGGLFFCLILGFFLYEIWGKKYWLILSFMVPIFSTIGDLVESTIKRSYNVKNSGIWFPGHGGFLDRLDSFIFVIPIIATIITSVVYLKKSS
ncbi:phosphatidate cytidylyltransferase [Blattabacterium sp. (Blattella germanica) str. Bge]|uniref:phosphatidate cytidylyltransferase n=1 Tax=Blattabacterium sp. (Blattella germanica) TaxID=624186 RepID=UPI0001BB612B|nr:phosphatidate cytidylyltransferase [Blattabacterium sp. (Blattella germanica)]ACY40245.1 phosphatidate cytidylyltransferase [Blattabacterium sp. (Blattella germanica) str. Bge]